MYIVEAKAGDEQQPNLSARNSTRRNCVFPLALASRVILLHCKEYCGQIAGCWQARERIREYIAKHDTVWSTPLPMERLPTELVIQILSYTSNKELKIIGFLSPEYRTLIIPFLFRHIRPWSSEARARDIDGLITCLRNNVGLSSAVRVLDAQRIFGAVEKLRRIMEITTRWEELTLCMGDHLPLAVLDDNTKFQLRRLRCISSPWPTSLRFHQLLLDILPTCPNLVEIWMPDREERIKDIDLAGLAAATWVNRLEKYGGPPYPLNYLHNSTPLYHLTCTPGIPSPLLQRLGGLVGKQLLHLHVPLYYHHIKLIRNAYLPPSLTPSLFPNLRYVAWFLIMPQPGDLVRSLLAPTSLLITHIQDLPHARSSVDMAALDANGILFDAIQQLHFLRHVGFISHHENNVPATFALRFVGDVQKMSPPSLQEIFLWAPNSQPWSFTFKKNGVGSTNEGAQKLWVCETNVPVPPFCH